MRNLLSGIRTTLAAATTKTRGDEAERIAERFLVAQGLHVLARNHRCRFGEIDLVMQDGDVVVFVEVRLRTSNAFGGALDSIHATKQKRLIAAAGHYLAGLRHTPPCRFDAILLNELREANVEWVKNIICS